MAATSVRRLVEHHPRPLPTPISLRALLQQPAGRLSLRFAPTELSVVVQNMALLVAPGNYLGRDRAGAIDELCRRLETLRPDVVGLCEVFADGEREGIRRRLRSLYPHTRDGPDEADLESDGGLLLLSRWPITASDDVIYRDCDGSDCFANKGMIHIRVQAPDWPSAVDVFLTHAQNIETDDGQSALYAQLDTMHDFVDRRSDPVLPAIIVGDLNIPAEQERHYRQLLDRLPGFRDCWTVAGNLPETGATLISHSSFHEDPDDRPDSDQRLDYVLLRAGSRGVPLLDDIGILWFTRAGRLISDHLGLLARFSRAAVITT